jgi:hypothetical protein
LCCVLFLSKIQIQRIERFCLEEKKILHPLLGVHCQPRGERQVLSPTRKKTAVVTDVGGTDYSRAVCILISQAVLVF